MDMKEIGQDVLGLKVELDDIGRQVKTFYISAGGFDLPRKAENGSFGKGFEYDESFSHLTPNFSLLRRQKFLNGG